MMVRICLLAVLLVAPLLGGARGIYRLLPHPDGPCQPGSDCVPVVLIHGIHQASVSGPCALDDGVASDCNWAPLFTHLSRRHPELWSRLRFYVFRYLSNRGDSVLDMGRELRTLVNSERGLWGKPFIIVAHSMGGLVARAFLNYQPHPFGPTGSQLARTLITLATPHHGTPLANRILRNGLVERITGAPAAHFDLFDLLFWGPRSGWQLASNATLPNRSDLLWDDHDGLFDGLRADLAAGSVEVNHSLAEIGRAANPRTRFILYGGYLEFDTPAVPADNLGQLLHGAGWLLNNHLAMPLNDGLVPLDSALFTGYPGAATRRVFAGLDHRDMMGNEPLFEALAADLAAAQ